ncbi:MAG: hypothetical protein L3J33_12835 [Rhodobacteraceae bacterium]|nr:hypothetical protein [Paracoccaceae bacterium]
MPELTTKQIRFLSKYLHVTTASKRFKRGRKKHADALVYNDLIKANFAKYEAKKAEADLLAGNVKQAIDHLVEMLGAVTLGAAVKRWRIFAKSWPWPRPR